MALAADGVRSPRPRARAGAGVPPAELGHGRGERVRDMRVGVVRRVGGRALAAGHDWLVARVEVRVPVGVVCMRVRCVRGMVCVRRRRHRVHGVRVGMRRWVRGGVGVRGGERDGGVGAVRYRAGGARGCGGACHLGAFLRAGSRTFFLAWQHGRYAVVGGNKRGAGEANGCKAKTYWREDGAQGEA